MFSVRIRTSSVGEGEVCLTRRQHHRWEGVVSFGATWLVVYSVFLLALSRADSSDVSRFLGRYGRRCVTRMCSKFDAR